MHEFLFWVIALSTSLCAIATVVTQNIVRAATWLLFTLAGASGIFFLLGADLVGAVQILVYVGGTLVLVIFGVMLTAQGPFINMKSSGAEWAVSTIVGVLLLGVLSLSALAIRNESGQKYSLSPTNEYRLGLPAGGRFSNIEQQPLAKYRPKDRLIKLTPERLKLEDDREKGKITAEEYETALRALTNQAAANSPYTMLIGQGLMGKPVGPAHAEKNLEGQRVVVRAHYLFPFEIVSVHLLVVLIGAAYLARAKRRRTQSPLVAGGPEGDAP